MPKPLDSQSLVDKARRFAEAAFGDYREGRDDFFALHAGTAFEALGKALLAKANPVLLVELGSKHRESLLHLAGVRDTRKLRTIPATEVFVRVGLVHQDIGLRGIEIEQIIDDRNAAAHLHVIPVGLHRAFVRWVRAVETVLGKLGQSPTSFWPDPNMVRTALAAYKTEVDAEVETKKAGARRHFARWRAEHGEEAVAMLREKRRPPLDSDEVAVPCPVCAFSAVISGDTDWETQDTDYGPAPAQLWLNAEAFRCSVCGLRLEGWDEIKTAGLEAEYEIEPPEYEPDEDDLYEMRRRSEEEDAF